MSSQVERLYTLLSDHEAHDTPEILKSVYGSDRLGISRIGARIFDLKRKYKLQIESWPDPKRKTVWHYRLVRNVPKQTTMI